MKLSQLVSKPQLTQIVIDTSQLVEKYGEPIEFWTWDRQPLDVFMRLAGAADGDNTNNILLIVKDLILDEKGNLLLTDDQMLPTDVLMASIAKITEMLGK